jgi:hypothetical protein
MANANLATPAQQNNPATFEKFWTDFGFTVEPSRAVESDIIEDESEERDDTTWRDFLGYHSEALR